ncbi:hypothetical protein AB1287_07280 [Enterobacter asburiae]|uniref:hypothetical protein n=1 Tax=Scandinavium sp. UTDF21-P1B TaxID=3446379 RepID=UPI003497F816
MILNRLAEKQSDAANSVIPPVTIAEGSSGNQSSGQMPAMAQVANVGNRMTPPCHRQCCEVRQACRQLKRNFTRGFPGSLRCCSTHKRNCEEASEMITVSSDSNKTKKAPTGAFFTFKFRSVPGTQSP